MIKYDFCFLRLRIAGKLCYLAKLIIKTFFEKGSGGFYAMLDWNKLMTPHRINKPYVAECEDQHRSDFFRDYDRVIFSTPFRRLNGKTQVFPVSQNRMFHTRLTHSLEAASVGRSLGRIVGEHVFQGDKLRGLEVGTAVSVACLAHDIGNPPFGHSGEAVIADFFRLSKMGRKILKKIPEELRYDFETFEGNAMGFHLLSNATSGLSLTFPILAAFLKYPCCPGGTGAPSAYKKHGIFRVDIEKYAEMANALGIPNLGSNSNVWIRHPLAYLTEAADDICYNIMDLEDGYKIKLVSYHDVAEGFTDIIHDEPPQYLWEDRIKKMDDERRFFVEKL